MRASDISAGDWLNLKPDNDYGMGPVALKVTTISYTEGYKTPWLTCVHPLTEKPAGSFRPSDFAKNYNDKP